MRQKYHKTEDIAVKEILSLLMEVLEAKYAKMRVFLKRQRVMYQMFFKPIKCSKQCKGNFELWDRWDE